MDILPFNKWTLQFENDEYEKIYQIEQNQRRLRYFKLMSILTSIVCKALFVIYILNKESVLAITIVASMDVFIIIGLFNCHRFEKQMNYLFGFMYILTLSISLYIATQYLRKSLYIQGLSTGSITAVSSLFFHYGLRIPVMLLIPPLHLYFLDSYNTMNISTECYFPKLCETKNTKIIKMNTLDSLFIIKLNPRTSQFELLLQNEASNQILNIEDTKTMINVFRNILVAPKGQIVKNDLMKINYLGETSMRRNIVKYQTLEEFAFYKIKEHQKFQNNQINELDAVFLMEKGNQDQVMKVYMNDFSYGQNSLIILIKKQSLAQAIKKETEQIKFLVKIIRHMSTWMKDCCQQLFQCLIKEPKSDNFLNLRCLSLSLMNQCSNFQVYLNQNRAFQESFQWEIVQFKVFLVFFEKYFSQIAQSQNKLFTLVSDNKELTVKINSKYLTQILINLIEYSLRFIDYHQKITLTISIERDLNPLKSNDSVFYLQKTEKKSIQNEERNDNLELDEQYLIKFDVSFQTKTAINFEQKQKFFLNPVTVEQFMINNNQEMNLLYSITNYLIQKIGPYNTIQIQQHWLPQEFSQMQFDKREIYHFMNSISFYIYADASQIDQSFVKYIGEKSFLDV